MSEGIMTDHERIQMLAKCVGVLCGAMEGVLDQLGPDFEAQANAVEMVSDTITKEFPGAVPVIKKSD